MKKNVGSIDKMIRVLIAVVIAILYFTHVVTGTFAVILLVIAGILVITSLLGICPLYLLLGLNTVKKN
jgi:hypothetical protein